MKNLKKSVAIMLCVVMALGCLTGCGKKSDEELLVGAATKMNSAKSVDMKAKMSGKLTMKMGDTSQDVDMNLELNATQFTDPMKVKITGTMNAMGTSTAMESYLQKEGDKYVSYVKSDGEWAKMSLGDLDQAMSNAGLSSIQTQLPTDSAKYKKQEDKTEGDKTYLVYTYEMTGEELKKSVEGAYSSMGSMTGGAGVDEEEMKGLLDAMMKDIDKVTMTIYVDRETECIARVDYPMADMMNKMFASMMDYLGDKAKEASEGSDEEDPMDLSKALSQINIEVPEMNMTTTYSNYDSAADFEIPKEALEAEDLSADMDEDASESESEE